MAKAKGVGVQGLLARAQRALAERAASAWGAAGSVSVGVPVALEAGASSGEYKTPRVWVTWCPATETAAGVTVGPAERRPAPAVLCSEFVRGGLGVLYVVQYEGEGKSKRGNRMHVFRVAPMTERVRGLPAVTPIPKAIRALGERQRR